MKKLTLWLIAFLFSASIAFAQPGGPGVLVSEVDGAPNTFTTRIVFPNGTITIVNGIAVYSGGAIAIPDLTANETITGNWDNTTNPWTDDEVSNVLTASIFVGTGSVSNAVDLATAEVNGLLDETNIDADITRDAEAAAAYQPLASDLTNIVANWTVDGSGNLSGVASIDLDPVASPYYTHNDSDCPGADKEIARYGGNYLSGADGSEDGESMLEVMLAGSFVQFLHYSADTEALTLGDSANGEDIVLDFDNGTANEIEATTNSGANVLNFSDFMFSSGSLTPVTGDADDFAANFTGKNLYGGTFVANGAGTAQLPAVGVGMNFTIITYGALAIVVEPNASDRFIMDGVLLDDADSATNNSAAGDIAVFQYYSADGWVVTTDGWQDLD